MSSIYPKIYSISTIGIRQHFNANYRFHHLRTDFSGESGSGKSMIADMIQLLLVGTAVFRSGTEGNKVRDPRGMLAEKKAGAYSRGYILLNIEQGPRQFITLGAYLESSAAQMRSFIIQNGYDWEDTLVPMDSPVLYEALLQDGQVVAAEELQNLLSPYYLKVLPLKKYQQLLYKNNILALDLSSNKQTLKSYATILRSFARGKGFDTEPEALKTFLFGNEDQLLLMEKYRDEVNNISADYQQHERYQQEIGLIREKHQAIEGVAAQFALLRSLRQDLALNSARFWYQQHARLAAEQGQLKGEMGQARFSSNLADQRLNKLERAELQRLLLDKAHYEKQIAQNERRLLPFEEAVAVAKGQVIRPEKEKQAIEELDTWLLELRTSAEGLQEHYERARKKNRDHALREEFIAYLKKGELLEAFENANWRSQSAQLQQLQELTQQIAEKQLFLAFSDLNNLSSLAAWAIAELAFPVSHEKESMLMHFQQLSRTEPETREEPRYLPFPETLFYQPDIPKILPSGFWLNLSGIYEWVDYVPVRYLDQPDGTQLQETLRIDQQNALAELALLSDKLEQAQQLYNALQAFTGLEAAIAAYKDKDLDAYVPHAVAELNAQDFAQRLNLYANKVQVLTDWKDAQDALDHAYLELAGQQNEAQTQQGHLTRTNKEIADNYGQIDPVTAIAGYDRQQQALEDELEDLIVEYERAHSYIQQLEARLFAAQPSRSALIKLKTDHDTEQGVLKIKLAAADRRFEEAQVKWEEAQVLYLKRFGEKFQPPEVPVEAADPAGLTKQCDDAEVKYITLYENAGRQIEDQTALEDHSLGVLANKLLPTVFPTSEVDEALIAQQIDRRLSKLMEDVMMIGSRKIELLNRVFSAVYNVYNEYLSKVHEINNYLKNKDHTITGGHHASLTYTKSVDFPDSWMVTFRKRLSEQLNNQGLFEKLYKAVDINQMMVEVFRECGGTAKVTPEELLNPKSYFDLKFEIKTDDGQNNAGSNGQTYTANALLCLARLSLIQDEKRTGLKFIPIDEAEGLGGNYEMLNQLAHKDNYQLITMSIETAGDINATDQYIYILHDNRAADEQSYVAPFAIFANGRITDRIADGFEL
ncbi:hypothetical protein [Mucilaginibacter sp.]|uniref:hypothetical protein n=1 Tax=Mucilaginibacter sp. TaxID=1882438 RepID=UPI00261377F9|nr:hypothetical protein [Mucilaginibacter sp.]MDB4922902.1 hypothetical protein [Mucilaginibacter sp.]